MARGNVKSDLMSAVGMRVKNPVEGEWASTMDAMPLAISNKQARNRDAYSSSTGGAGPLVRRTPIISIEKFFNENAAGSLKDLLVRGDAVSIYHYYGSASSVHRITEVKDRSVTVAIVRADGTLGDRSKLVLDKSDGRIVGLKEVGGKYAGTATIGSSYHRPNYD